MIFVKEGPSSTMPENGRRTMTNRNYFDWHACTVNQYPPNPLQISRRHVFGIHFRHIILLVDSHRVKLPIIDTEAKLIMIFGINSAGAAHSHMSGSMVNALSCLCTFPAQFILSSVQNITVVSWTDSRPLQKQFHNSVRLITPSCPDQCCWCFLNIARTLAYLSSGTGDVF